MNKTMKLIFKLAVLIIFIIAAPSVLHAGDGIKQFQKHGKIDGKIPVSILLIGWEKDEADITRLMDLIYAKANEAYYKLDASNPKSEISRLNAAAGKGSYLVSEELMAIFQAAIKVARLSKGAFDITTGGNGNYRKIIVKKGKSSVQFKKEGMKISFDGIVEGFLADLLIRYIHASNMHNAIVKVGSIFRSLGQAANGPWKIQIQDDAGTFAHRALNLTLRETSVATVSASQFHSKELFDPRSKEKITPPCKGAVVVLHDAAIAQGLAHAAFILGPEKGFELITKTKGAKGMIVDKDGNFLRSSGF